MNNKMPFTGGENYQKIGLDIEKICKKKHAFKAK